MEKATFYKRVCLWFTGRRIKSNIHKKSKYFSDKKLKKNISKAHLHIDFKHLDDSKKKSVGDIMEALNSKNDVFVKGENGSGKSEAIKVAMEYSKNRKNLFRIISIPFYFIGYFIVKPFSFDGATWFKNRIMTRRQKDININLWSLFSLKSSDDYPCDMNKMKTTGMYEIEKKGIKKRIFSTYDESSIKKDSKNRGFESGQATHLYIKRIIWGTIMNLVSPKHKSVNLEKILHKETFVKGPTFIGIWTKALMFLILTILVLVGTPILLFYGLNGFNFPAIKDMGEPPQIIKLVSSLGVGAVISTICFFARKLFIKSKTMRINPILVDQSNNVFISKAIKNKTKFRIINIHFEDFDRLQSWLKNSGKCSWCQESDKCYKNQIIKTILMNINLLYDIENVRIITEINQEIIDAFMSKNKNNEKTPDFGYKIFNKICDVPSPTSNSVFKTLSNDLDNEDELFPKKMNLNIKRSSLSFSHLETLNNISIEITELINVSDKSLSWRIIEKVQEPTKNFILDYYLFLRKDNFNSFENRKELFKKIAQNAIFRDEDTKQYEKLSKIIMESKDTMSLIMESMISSHKSLKRKLYKDFLDAKIKQKRLVTLTNSENMAYLFWIFSKSVILNSKNVISKFQDERWIENDNFEDIPFEEIRKSEYSRGSFDENYKYLSLIFEYFIDLKNSNLFTWSEWSEYRVIENIMSLLKSLKINEENIFYEQQNEENIFYEQQNEENVFLERKNTNFQERFSEVVNNKYQLLINEINFYFIKNNNPHDLKEFCTFLSENNTEIFNADEKNSRENNLNFDFESRVKKVRLYFRINSDKITSFNSDKITSFKFNTINVDRARKKELMEIYAARKNILFFKDLKDIEETSKEIYKMEELLIEIVKHLKKDGDINNLNYLNKIEEILQKFKRISKWESVNTFDFNYKLSKHTDISIVNEEINKLIQKSKKINIMSNEEMNDPAKTLNKLILIYSIKYPSINWCKIFDKDVNKLADELMKINFMKISLWLEENIYQEDENALLSKYEIKQVFKNELLKEIIKVYGDWTQL